MDVNEFKDAVDRGKGGILTHQFLVSESVYQYFQKCSGDKNPLHTDDSFARNKGFKERVMYGNILNAFVSYFIGECLPTKDVIIHSQDIVYKKPVYLNDQLNFEAKIDGIYESVETVEFSFKFINSDKQVVAKGHVQIGILK
jgi:3-hydroxybutyryl-CoA dehydratase